MPHIIIEHSVNSLKPTTLTPMLHSMKQVVIETQLFEAKNIKIRLHPVEHSLLDETYQGFVHIQCRIHNGRGDKDKQVLSKILCDEIQQWVKENTVITVEVVDMDTASYSKTTT